MEADKSNGMNSMTRGIDLPILTIFIILQLILDHPDHNFIANQATGVHDLFSFYSKGRLFGNLLAEHVPCGEVADAEFVFDAWSLRAFACNQTEVYEIIFESR